MPTRKLDDAKRRALTLASLAPDSSPAVLAREYEVTPSYIHKLRADARENVKAELEYWSEVNRILKGGAMP